MILEERLALMVRLGKYLAGTEEDLAVIIQKAHEHNKWFIPEFTELALLNIANNLLDEEKLKAWIKHYHLDDNISTHKVGIVMAGNIPLVGFHDFLCAFISGQKAIIKCSTKDDQLLPFLVKKLNEWDSRVCKFISFADMLKNCDAYIATGSNNSSRYFEYYFGKYPSIIRKNKTSVAMLSGEETIDELSSLADDVYLYFGLGCRNVTKIMVPQGYDFIPLLKAFNKYNYLADFSMYKNNYDYNLALLIMNNKLYMSNESIILTESDVPFSPVSQLHYSFYDSQNLPQESITESEAVQCVVGNSFLPFGEAQKPGLSDYADGVDTMAFLLSL
jgi:hypothetical protein